MLVRDEAIYMLLNMRSASDEAKKLIDDFAKRTWNSSKKARMEPSRSHIDASSAVVAELIKAASYDLARYCYRSMAKDSFTKEAIGYRSFRQIVEGAEAERLVDRKAGYGGEASKGARAARFRGTKEFFDLVQSHGITPANFAEHFASLPRPSKIGTPIVLKGRSVLERGKKRSGASISFDPRLAPVSELTRQVETINAYMADVAIAPHWCHLAFHRVFNDGDVSGYGWNKGGRLYSMGGGYQNMPQADRKAIRLNGEATVELDIRASHLTILHALLGEPFDPAASDPYQHATLPREVVKTWVTMTLGNGDFHKRWSFDASADYRRTHGKSIGEDFPIEHVKDEVLKMLPALSGWPTCRFRWGDLQYIESCAIIDTVEQLAKQHSVPALPVHDSIIVPASKQELAAKVLKANFLKHVGVEPTLSAK